SGLLEGNPKQLLNQLIASLIAIAMGVVGSFILLKLIDLTIGVRVSNEDEAAGLDISQHGEEGYNMDMDLVTTGAYTYGGSGTPIVEPAMRTVDALEK
ncbi:MAG TPA: hypothetical protein VGB07_31040, partial [Blastocatellia bacterium]